MFQSTRPRGARHDGNKVEIIDKVSIHAPAGGATAITSKPGYKITPGYDFAITLPSIA
ncbi:MAG: hypothetical protein GQF41_4140 [Candidatus Rifleibacterium amylolyticum]|nr:MAG: hypothetical protein GQF41_4140 [Candidatus Rifleibacterium amylolyticum]